MTLDLLPSSSGSTTTLASGLIGPATPRAAQPLGAATSTISWVIVRSDRPTFRVVVNLAPSPSDASPSNCTRTTSYCHSANRAGSVP